MSNSSFHGIFSALNQETEPEQQPKPPVQQTAAPVTTAQTGTSGAVGQVAVDIYEQDNYYIIKSLIAGVRLSDLDIEVSENTITIRGVRQQSDDLPRDQYYVQECFWGPFARTVTLPCQIDPRKIKATFNKECILKILVPKEDRVKIVRITES